MKMTNTPLVVHLRDALWLHDRREWEVNILPEDCNDGLGDLIRSGVYPKYAELAGHDGFHMKLTKLDTNTSWVWLEYRNVEMDVMMTVLMRTDL